MSDKAIDTVMWFLLGKDERDSCTTPMVRRMFKLLIKTHAENR